MKKKMAVGVLVLAALFAAGTVFAQRGQTSQQSWINSAGNQCFSVQGVETEYYKKFDYTVFTNTNGYKVTVAYSVNGRTGTLQLGAYGSGHTVARVNGEASIINCLPE
jgi:hypothetical protein